MKEVNTEELLKEILKLLSQNDIICWVFGGWAEELRGLCKPRKHKDIDLLYPADDFHLVDQFIKNQNLEEVKGKHFFHKRAFLVKGIVVELFLVQTKQGNLVTNFFEQKEYCWPENVFDKRQIDDLFVASIESLKDYRSRYNQFH